MSNKRPPFNPGTGVGRALPNVDANPDTNPATAALAAGAAMQTDHLEPLGTSEPLKPQTPSVPPAPRLEKPRFSMLESDVLLLDELCADYRRATGLEVTPSRIMRAALRQFAEHPDRQQLIGAVEELKPGRKPARS